MSFGDRLDPRHAGAAALAVLAVVFVTAVTASNALLGGLRLDLTEHRLYTLSDGTLRLIERIEEPVTLTLYWSDTATGDLPWLRTYAQRVRETLEEMRDRAGGMIRLQVVDPVPFSEDEDRAQAFGLQGYELGPGADPVYFGLAGSSATGDRSLIPFFDPDKEPFLEYDLARLLHTLLEPEPPVVGVLSGLPMGGGFDPNTGFSEPWVVYEQAEQLFELRELPTDVARIDGDVDVLWLVHPARLSPQALYAVDQYVLGGGHALVFVDPYAEIARGDEPASTLEPLFEAWGIDYSPDAAVLDHGFALQVSGTAQQRVLHPGIFGVRGEAIAAGEAITAQLDAINFAYPGHLRLREDSPLSLQPVLRSSAQAGVVPSLQVHGVQDPSALPGPAGGDGEPLTLAAWLTGEVHSAFPDGPPEGNGDAGTEAPATDHLARSASPATMLLVADADMLADRMWVQVQSFFGQRMPSAFASNGDFVINALEHLGGGTDLIGIRGRAPFQRPFTRVDELRRQADARVSDTLERLRAELDETERRIARLQGEREDAGSLLPSPEQTAEIERFRERQLELRQELRRVQREREHRIEQLGGRLKALNIGLVPGLLTLGALAYLAVARRRGAPA